MRIIGGHDYYDTALSYGHDENTVFVRGDETLSIEDAKAIGLERSKLKGTLELESKKKPRRRRRSHSWSYLWRRDWDDQVETRNIAYSITYPTVIVCGKRFQGVRVEAEDLRSDRRYKTQWFWTHERFAEWVTKAGLEFVEARKGELEAYFETTDLPKTLLGEVISRGWSILVNDEGRPDGRLGRDGAPWMIDPDVLGELAFYRAMDPVLLFQEIDMWLGGVVASSDKEMIEISDADKIAKHGMDETSFRKAPSKKRK